MANVRYVPTTELSRLQKLVEESGRLIQLLGRSEKWGMRNFHPEDKRNPPAYNGDVLLYELDEVQRAIEGVRIDLLLAGFAAKPPHGRQP